MSPTSRTASLLGLGCFCAVLCGCPFMMPDDYALADGAVDDGAAASPGAPDPEPSVAAASAPDGEASNSGMSEALPTCSDEQADDCASSNCQGKKCKH